VILVVSIYSSLALVQLLISLGVRKTFFECRSLRRSKNLAKTDFDSNFKVPFVVLCSSPNPRVDCQFHTVWKIYMTGVSKIVPTNVLLSQSSQIMVSPFYCQIVGPVPQLWIFRMCV
jgi:hypothetical protein